MALPRLLALLIFAVAALNSQATSVDNDQHGRVKRSKYVGPEEFRWPDGKVFWQYRTEYKHKDKRPELERSMSIIEKYTCVTFEELKSNSHRLPYYLRIVDGRGCWSSLGCMKKIYGSRYGRQDLSLSRGCYKGHNIRTVLHELGHALGLYHEQSRPDRDDNVSVFKDNIRASELPQYEKYPWSVTGRTKVPYNYASAMHYGSRFFTDKGLATMQTKDWRDQFMIGFSSPGLGEADYQAINAMYKCDKNCRSGPKECLNEGQRVHKPMTSECECRCPEGLTGDQCETVSDDTSVCGGVLEIGEKGGIITTPGFPSPYKNGQRCTWLIKANNPSDRITLNITDYDLTPSDRDCYEKGEDTLEIRRWGLINFGTTYCAKTTDDVPPILTSLLNTVLIRFSGNKADGDHKGIRIEYTINKKNDDKEVLEKFIELPFRKLVTTEQKTIPLISPSDCARTCLSVADCNSFVHGDPHNSTCHLTLKMADHTNTRMFVDTAANYFYKKPAGYDYTPLDWFTKKAGTQIRGSCAQPLRKISLLSCATACLYTGKFRCKSFVYGGDTCLLCYRDTIVAATVANAKVDTYDRHEKLYTSDFPVAEGGPQTPALTPRPRKDCYYKEDQGVSYVGTSRRTLQGMMCQSWFYTKGYGPGSKFQKDNPTRWRKDKYYCRNPGDDPEKTRPWCYTNTPCYGIFPLSRCKASENWSYCKLPMCTD
ncbi:MEP1B [Branchiostoma lanceolatum]|uniref:Metalloendopeptidase n=1 Tax=Branchiostoma lanceolatum TaxID=7740 RepID=A0A8J9ZHP4_BRALA|nr:MEP1B [Branchiostoma lanceolatum]